MIQILQLHKRKMELVKKCGVYLSQIEEQTPEMCIEAVKQCGVYLYFVKNQTPEICIEAVKNNGIYLQFVKIQTPEICMEALKNNPDSIRYVKIQFTDNLVFKTVVNTTNEPCSICFDVFDNMCKLTCGHIFHYDCIMECIKTCKKCPYCKQILL